LRMPVDERIKQYIKQLVFDGVYNVAEVERHTSMFVKNQLFSGKPLPSGLNRRFYSTKSGISNIMYSARVSQMHSRIDQDNLQALISTWQENSPDDNFYFRPYVECDDRCPADGEEVTVTSEGQAGLLIVHQSAWQRRMLQKYGCLCLMDATYKTTRYAVPLFFLCVRTNVDYVVVATFISQFEDRRSIVEALNIIVSWNPDWSPQSFMVDFCEAEIRALEEIFAGDLSLLWCYLNVNSDIYDRLCVNHMRPKRAENTTAIMYYFAA
jgi:MULE transposase domain/Amyotrophic lateral sclerosis 2 chromosomal region candidate gene 8